MPKFEKPSEIVKIETEKVVNRVEKEIAINLSRRLAITREEAEDLIGDQAKFKELMRKIKDTYMFNMAMDTIPLLVNTVTKHLENKEPDKAKNALVAWAIASDKAFGEPFDRTAKTNKTSVQVNLGFKFRPFGRLV